uniref:Large ribosomal subunit protein eL24-related N-terminal domain-containing protein n=1 Tax=Pseudictyota dubia TaxID=2749911 RepID=A0A7R9WJE8_9STRA|mmetsp:Transcript_7953/g.14496  ORF Transcript_7953/g.14496 Transcript_7953/m.14496 type:complete len:153 (+) Transcript_7953:447-905(+)
MVIATELCALSEYRIYPGNGKLFIRRDGRPMFFGTSKAYSLTMQRKKPAKLVWTQAWRRLNKKGLTETLTKKRTRRTNKVARAVVGISLEDIRKRAAQKPEFRTAQREAALKEVKSRKAASKGKGGKGQAGQTYSSKVPKTVKRAQKGGSQR